MSAMKLPKGVLPLLILVVGVIGAVAMVKLKPAPPKRPAIPHQVVVKIHRMDAETPVAVITGYGSVAARRRIAIVPQVSGIVAETASVLVAGGTFVNGETLLRLDDADYRLAVDMTAAQVARQEFNLATAQQEAEIARREWDRIRSEDSETLVRPNPLVLHAPQLKLAQAELTSAQASLAQAKLNLDRCIITAPFSGRVVEENVDQGQYVRTGTTLATIYATDLAEVAVPLPDDDLAFFEVPNVDGTGGADVDLVASYAGLEHVWNGRVTRLSGALDPQTRLVDVIVAVENGYAVSGDRPALLDGMFVEARIQGRAVTGTLSMPRSALREDDLVWIVDAQGKLEIRRIKVARLDRETVFVAGGLAPGDEVVVSQHEVVSNGMQVKVAGRPGAKPNGAPGTSQPDEATHGGAK